MATRTASPLRFTSGRGGAGNMTIEHRASRTAKDLVTPTLKQDMYTTGRGGSGNMAKLESVDNARKAQDVEAPIHREPETAFHYGRGGANVAIPSEEEKRQAREKNKLKSDEVACQAHGGEKSLAGKLKEKVGLGSRN